MRHAALAALAVFATALAACAGNPNYAKNDPTVITSGKQATDPICHMDVDRKKAYRATHNGQDYYFCSEQCEQEFKKNPTSFPGSSSNRMNNPTGK